MAAAPEGPSPTGAVTPGRGRRRPSRRAALLAAAAALTVAGGSLVALGLGGDAPELPAAAAPVASERDVAPEPALTVPPASGPATPAAAAPSVQAPSAPAPPVDAPQPTAAAALGADADIRLRVPSVDLDLPVHALEPDGGAINPPTMSDAYWIDPYGEPGAGASAPDNTVYIAAHSWSRGEAAFDPLLDADLEGGAVGPGDVVEVETASGTAEYAVTDVRRYGKDALPDADAVWEVHPGRLVLITCFQREDGRRSTENLVVTAEEPGGAGGR